MLEFLSTSVASICSPLGNQTDTHSVNLAAIQTAPGQDHAETYQAAKYEKHTMHIKQYKHPKTQISNIKNRYRCDKMKSTFNQVASVLYALKTMHRLFRLCSWYVMHIIWDAHRCFNNTRVITKTQMSTIYIHKKVHFKVIQLKTLTFQLFYYNYKIIHSWFP